MPRIVQEQGRMAGCYARNLMGLGFYIPKSLFAPLPDWAVPWVMAGCVLTFVVVVVWAIRQRGR